MKEQFYEFFFYVWLLIKRLLIWALFIAGIWGLIKLVRINESSIPSILLWVVICIGLVWTSFKVFKEQQKAVPPGKEIIKMNRQPRISISFLEANELTYSLEEIGVKSIMGDWPMGRVELHAKIVNNGLADAEVLSMQAHFYPHELWYVDYHQEVKVLDNQQNEITFPFHLMARDKLIGHMLFPIEPHPTLNKAQIKDRLLRHQKEAYKFRVEIELEYLDATKKIKNAKIMKILPTEQFVEIYIARLHELKWL